MNYTMGNFGKLSTYNFFWEFGENGTANSAVQQQSARVCSSPTYCRYGAAGSMCRQHRLQTYSGDRKALDEC